MTAGEHAGPAGPDEGAASRRDLRSAGHARGAARRRRRPVLWASLLLIVVVLGAVAWVGMRAWTAKGELETAQGLIDDVKAAISDGDYEGAVAPYEQIRHHTVRARSMTDDPLWNLGRR
jgi:hypothetical protein